MKDRPPDNPPARPLYWPDAFCQPVKRHWLTWLIGPKTNYQAVLRGIAEQLLARQKPDSAIWGSSLLHAQIGPIVCKVIQQTYNWPNDYFIPQDVLDIACLMPDDDLELVEIGIELEDLLGVPLDATDLYSLADKTLGAFVDWIVEKVRCSQFNSEGSSS